MNFGDLFFLFIFVAIILLNLYKKMAKPAKAAEEKKPASKPAWKQVLDDVMKQLNEEVVGEAAPGAEAPPVPPKTGWEDIVQYKPAEPVQEIKVQEPVREERPVEPVVPMAAVEAVPAKPEVEKKMYPHRIKQAELPVPGLAAKMRGPEAVSVKDLKRAVIWSEILASPVGLRDLEV